jgi:hypothetical protein
VLNSGQVFDDWPNSCFIQRRYFHFTGSTATLDKGAVAMIKRSAFCALPLLLLTAGMPAAWAGPVFLTGHDPDFHSQSADPEGAGASNLLMVGLDFATGSTTASATEKFLWVESRISTPPGHRVGEAGLGELGLTLGTHYDRANGAELAAVEFSDYTAIAIASSFGGLLTRAELDALIARSADIEDYINAGGGLFASAECDNCGQDLLGDSPDLFGYLPVAVTSIGTSPPFFVTPFGSSLGLVNSDLNAPTHNSFGVVGGLNIVDIDTAGNATTLAGVVSVDDGGFIPSVPEPTTILLLGLGLAGLGFARKRLH